MTDPIDAAMVLAAGLGTRFRAVSGDLPKPLVTVAGKPLLDWTLDLLAAGNIKRAVVNVHYKADLIESHLERRLTPNISISDERAQLMETGGGLMQATPLMGDGPVFCSNTDAIFDPSAPSPVRMMREAWENDTMDALLLLVPLALTSGYDGEGDFIMSADGRLQLDGDGEKYVFTGLQIIHPRLWHGETPVPGSTRRFWDRAMAHGRMIGLLLESRWMHVGDPAGFEAANRALT